MNTAPDFLIFSLTVLGFSALSASMERHAKQIFGTAPQGRARVWRAAVGGIALALPLIPALHAYGLSIGVSVWVGFLAVSATVVALLLSYRPRALRPVFCLAIAGALAAAALLPRPPGATDPQAPAAATRSTPVEQRGAR
jgi:hypothetical protein